MSELVIFETGGEQVAFDPAARMWNLTAMHQASGANPSKEPSRWLRGAQAQELLTALAEKLNGRISPIYNEAGDSDDEGITTADIVQTRRGRYDGGTWAHWQIAAAYAHYLNPHFYLQWNEWAMAYRSGQDTPVVNSTIPHLTTLEARIAAIESRLPEPQPARYLMLEHPQARAIFNALSNTNGPLTAREIIAILERDGVAMTCASQVRVRLRRMADRGVIVRRSWGLYQISETVSAA